MATWCYIFPAEAAPASVQTQGESLPSQALCRMNHIKVDHCRLQAYPALLAWMMYPLGSLLENIYQEHLPKLIHIRTLNSPCRDLLMLPLPKTVEFVACIERTLAFEQTGNTKCLATALMSPLWIVRSLLIHGIPTFSPDIKLGGINNSFHIELRCWPTHPPMSTPEVASKRAQQLTYGMPHFMVSTICLETMYITGMRHSHT